MVTKWQCCLFHHSFHFWQTKRSQPISKIDSHVTGLCKGPIYCDTPKNTRLLDLGMRLNGRRNSLMVSSEPAYRARGLERMRPISFYNRLLFYLPFFFCNLRIVSCKRDFRKILGEGSLPEGGVHRDKTTWEVNVIVDRRCGTF